MWKQKFWQHNELYAYDTNYDHHQQNQEHHHHQPEAAVQLTLTVFSSVFTTHLAWSSSPSVISLIWSKIYVLWICLHPHRHLELVPALAQSHSHIRGEDTVEDAHNASLRPLTTQIVPIVVHILVYGAFWGHLQYGVGDHVCVLVDALVLRVDAEKEGGHPQEEEQHHRGLHPFPLRELNYKLW